MNIWGQTFIGRLLSGQILSWNGDTGLSRESAGVVDVGNGTQGDKSGTIKAAAFGSGAGALDFNTTNAGLWTASGGGLVPSADNAYPLGSATKRWNAAWLAGTVTTGALNNMGSLTMQSGQQMNWNGDTGLSRDSAGVLDVGNGTPGDKSGTVQAAAINAVGSANTVSLTGATSGNAVSVTASGSDTNVGITFVTKGNGAVGVTSSGSPQFFGNDIVARSANVIAWLSRTTMKSPADGQLTLLNTAQTGFGRLQFGGTTSSFPSLKLNGAGLGVRLADDSSDANLTCGQLNASGVVVSLSTTVGLLPTAATVGAGARAFVTDANSTSFMSTVVGGGSNKVPVVSDGTNWKIG
jgi:hypothetical protein